MHACREGPRRVLHLRVVAGGRVDTQGTVFSRAREVAVARRERQAGDGALVAGQRPRGGEGVRVPESDGRGGRVAGLDDVKKDGGNAGP